MFEEDLEKNEVEYVMEAEFLAVSEAHKAIFWPPPGF